MKTNTPGAGKKVQQLSALAASPEDGGIQFLPPRWQLTSVTPVPGIQHLLASIGTGHIHTLSHIKKKKKTGVVGHGFNSVSQKAETSTFGTSLLYIFTSRLAIHSKTLS